MYNLTKKILVSVALVFVLFWSLPQLADAQFRVFQPDQGGTGIGSATVGDVGDCITVLDDSPFTYQFSPCGSGGGGDSVWSRTAGGLIYAPTTTDSVAIGGTSEATASWFFNPVSLIQYIGGDLGIGTTSPDVPLHIGTNVAQTPDATIMMSRNITGAGNGHGISDETYFNTTNGSYNSFDARAQIYGIGTSSGSHHAAFQARPDFSTGTVVPIYRAYHAASPSLAASTTITDYYGFLFSGPTITSGEVTNAYGLYVSNIGAATNKYGVYVVADKSYFGGNVGFGTTTPHSLADFSNATGEQITLSDTNSTTDTKNWYIESDSGEFNIGTTSDNFSVTPNAFFSIEPSGEMGIAQPTPTSILEIGGNAYDTQGLFEANGSYTANSSGVSGGVFEAMQTLNLNTGVTLANTRFDASVNTTVDQTAIYGTNNTLSLASVPNTITDAILSQSSLSRGASYTGTTTNLRGYRYIEGTNSGTGVITNQMGINIAALDDATNNTSILLGNTTAQTGNFGILSATNYPNVFRASTTDSTAAPLVIQGSRAAILTGNSLGNLQFWSNDTNYTPPGFKTAGIGAVAEGTHTASVAPTALTFETASSSLVPVERMRLTNTGNLGIGTTTTNAKLNIYGGGVQIDPGGVSIPTCNVSTRGQIWNTFGGTGVADTAQVCRKDAADAYAWTNLY